MTPTGTLEILDAKQLAERLNLPESWVRNHSQDSARNRIPHVKCGRYCRYEWISPELAAWWEKQKQK
jgi:hypothetical protein